MVLTVVAIVLQIAHIFVVELAGDEEIAVVGSDDNQLAGVVVEVVVVFAAGVVDGVAGAGSDDEGVDTTVGHDGGVLGDTLGDEGAAVGV